MAPGIAAIQAKCQVITVPWMFGIDPAGFGRDAYAKGSHQYTTAQCNQIGINDGANDLNRVVFYQLAPAFYIFEHVYPFICLAHIEVGKYTWFGRAPGFAFVLRDAFIQFLACAHETDQPTLVFSFVYTRDHRFPKTFCTCVTSGNGRYKVPVASFV